MEKVVKNCRACTDSTNKEPLKMIELLKEPWKEVSIDFCGPCKAGEYILVVIDDYSQYPEIEILHSTFARATIPKLEYLRL